MSAEPMIEREARAWGSVRGKGDRYFVRFTIGRKRYERGPFSTWNAADKMRRRARALLEGGTPLPQVLAGCFGDFLGAKLTFREATAHYLAYAAGRKRETTLAVDRIRLRAFGSAPWAGKILGAIRSDDFLAWMGARQRGRTVQRLRKRREGESPAAFAAAADRLVPKAMPGVSGASLNRDLNLVSAVFRWAMRAGYVEDNPVRRVERFQAKGAREVYLTAAESVGLVASCSPALRPLVLTAVSTGMRRGELLALRWRSVDLDRREIRVEAETEKAGRGRVVPMTAALREALKDLKANRAIPALDGSDPVFCLADGSPVTVAVLRALWEADVDPCEALPLAKRGKVTLHVLRHTAASLMVGAGVPLLDVARILGHSTLAVTMRYAHFAPESGRNAIDALGAVLTKAATPDAVALAV